MAMQISSRKIFVVIGCLVLAGTWLITNNKEEPLTIRIATNPWPGYEYIHLASKKGFFNDEGLHIQLVRFTSLEDTRRAFELNKVDGMTATLVELMQAHEYGTDGKIALVTDYSNGGDMIIARKGINTVADLKGKTIAIEPATLSALFISRSLNKFGLSLADVRLEGMNPLDMESALLSGKVDAAHSYTPTALTILQHNEQLQKIFDSSQINKKIIDIVVLNNNLLAENKGIVSAIRRAWDRTKAYADDNPEEANKIMANVEGISVDEFNKSLALVKVLGASEREALMNVPEFVESINEVGQFLHKEGELKKPAAPAETYMIIENKNAHE